MNKNQLRPIETIQEDEFEQFENQAQNEGKHAKKGKQTGAKKSKKGIALLLIAATVTVGGLAYVGTQYIEGVTQAKRATERATSIVSLYQTGELCCIDEPVYSTKNYDTKICDGQTLVDVLNANQIKYCEILDEYYTKDGRPIAIVTLEVEHTETIKPEAMVDEKLNVSYYTVPEGYEFVDGYYRKTTTETRTIVTEADQNNAYDKLSLPGVSIKRVISVDVISTKSYDEIISSDFVCDVKDDYAEHLKGQLSEATYRLIPKRN